jgi:hypothetical protein
MLSSTRTFLLILLAMLQFIAPLVHAHARQHYLEIGLHLPGLEKFHAADESSSSDARLLSAHSDDFIFSVDDGIKQSRPPMADDAPADYLLFRPFPDFRTAKSSLEISYPPHISPFIPHFSIALLSPRAPPSLNLLNRSIPDLSPILNNSRV